MQVFLSYADSDLPLAKRIAQGLGAAGFQVWYDDLYVFPGDNWGKAVGEALEQSEAMVVLLTRDGLRSKKVTSETQFALGNLRYEHRLIPVVSGLDDGAIQKHIPWVFRHLTPVYISDEDIELGLIGIIQALNQKPAAVE